MSRQLLVSADRVSTARGVVGRAVLVEAGRVRAVGEPEDLIGDGVPHHTYPGATLVPGLRDAHLHPVPYAAALAGISLKTAADLAELKQRLRAAHAATPGRSIVALRLDDETLAEGRLPTRLDLDAAVDSVPVLAHRYCGHVAVANSKALARAGIDASTPDPAGGAIDRDGAGRPTGVLRETAVEIVSKALTGGAPVSGAAVVGALTGLVGLGITSIGAMVRPGDGPWASLGDEVAALCAVADDLPLTVYAYVIADSSEQLREAKAMMDAAGSRLRWAGLKRFSDGSLGGHTAAMIDPYSDAPDTTGTLRLTATDAALARTCLAMGGSVAIHAIGDRACAEVLDLFELLVSEGARPDRLRLEHASVLTAGDIQRIGSLGITGSVQPAFLASETSWLEHRVGSRRLARTYPFRSLLDAGATLAAGSDCPVEPPNPWPAMATAIDRAGVMPGEGVTPAEALGMFTDGGAAALLEPPPLGVGSPADLAIVDRDPLTVGAVALRNLDVIATYVSGNRCKVDTGQRTWNE